MNQKAVVIGFPVAGGASAQQVAARSVAGRQLEIADLYLAAAEGLDLGNLPLRRSLGRIRGEVAAARRELNASADG